jgi:SAM-dependent methyltransferase
MTDAATLPGAIYRAPPEGDWETVDLEFLNKCPVCGNEDRAIAYEGLRDKIFFCAPGVWTMWRCAGCNVGYLDPRPTRGSIGRAYASYFTHAGSALPTPSKAPGLLNRLRRIPPNSYLNKFFGYRLRPSLPAAWLLLAMQPRRALTTANFYRRLPAPRKAGDRLLDIGCGSGDFLQTARDDLGYQVEGLEIDPAALAVARGRGLLVHPGRIPGSGLSPEAYYQITLSHVVEHLHDPVAALHEVFYLLKPGGRVWITVPNLAAASLKRFGANSRLLEPPRHLVMFDPDSLRALLERTGYIDIDLVSEPNDHASVINQSRMIELGIDPHSMDDNVWPTEILAVPTAPMDTSNPSAEIISIIAFKPEH